MGHCRRTCPIQGSDAALSSSPVSLRAVFIAALAAVAAPRRLPVVGDVTGSIPASGSQPTDEARLRAYADELGKRYDRNPGEKTASIEYARALRALTRYNEAVAVIQTAAIKAPKDFDAARRDTGKALADAGQLTQAKDVSEPRLYARQSALGRHVGAGYGRRPARRPRGAMQFYHDALKIAPGEPSVLTNMGLSLAWPRNCRRPRMP